MDGPDSPVEERISPEEAFALLGDGTRMAILRALGDADDPLSFSGLRERVGERDSGKFNYHLKKLTDHFVRRGEEGYELTLAGSQVVGALLAGTYTAEVSFEPIGVDHPCPECGGELIAEYAAERVHVRCKDCEEWVNRFTFPPGTIEQFARDELPAAFDSWLRTTLSRQVAGFCGVCSGRLDASLHPGSALSADDPAREGREPVRAEYRCERCGSTTYASVYLPLLFHPAAVSFLYDHGVDATSLPTWEVRGRLDAIETELRSTDPTRARATLELDGERLVAEVDESVAVVDIRREAVGGRA